MTFFKDIRRRVYDWFHRREIAENNRLLFLLARRDILVEHQSQYILHLRKELKKLFKTPRLHIRPESVTQIGHGVLELRFNERWNTVMPHDFEDLAPDIRKEWASQTAKNAVNALEEQLTEDIFKHIN